MEIAFFVSWVDALQSFKFHENEAKHDERNFKEDLTVTF